jgi:hypothetical protein
MNISCVGTSIVMPVIENVDKNFSGVDKKFSYVLEKNSQSHVLKMIRTQCG